MECFVPDRDFQTFFILGFCYRRLLSSRKVSCSRPECLTSRCLSPSPLFPVPLTDELFPPHPDVRKQYCLPICMSILRQLFPFHFQPDSPFFPHLIHMTITDATDGIISNFVCSNRDKIAGLLVPTIKPERFFTATQDAIHPARRAFWLKLVLNPASCKPVCIASHPSPSPHNDITSSSERSTSITTPSSIGHGHDKDVAATAARPSGCAALGYFCSVVFAFDATHPPRCRPCCCVYVATDRPLFGSSCFSRLIPSCQQRVQARAVAADGNQICVKGCTAVW